jgi:branched-chain amino acid transport system substrate-binding protein
MLLDRRWLFQAGIAAAVSPFAPRARAATAIRLGVLTDMSGPNANNVGLGSVAATKMAAEDFTRAHPDIPVEVLSADLQAKADVAISVGRDWMDTRGVDCITNVNNSAAALALVTVVREKDKVALLTGPASSDLTGKACTPNHVQWTYDSYAMGNSTGKAVVAEGGDTWFFIAADYAFGRSLVRDATRAVTSSGGKVLGEVYHPFPDTSDFSSFLLQAQASGAKVICLANSGENAINTVKQAHEFGLTVHGQKICWLVSADTDIHAIGLEAAQGLIVTSAFYWDMNDGTRAFARRFGAVMQGRKPNQFQAGDYAATTHYLRAVRALGVERARSSGRLVVEQMKAMRTDDPLMGQNVVRADGRELNPMYLFQVKSPAESRYDWDYYKLLRTIPGDKAFRPLADGGCPMIPTK